MATTLGFKDLIDIPSWRPLAVSSNASAAGTSLIWDMRNNTDAHPEVFQLINATTLNSYHVKNDGWSPQPSPALSGTFGAGAGGVFMPARGPRGTIASGSTTSKLNITLSAGLLGALAGNQLSARGDGRGFKIRVIGNGTASSGKIQEQIITANQPAASAATSLVGVVLDAPLSWTPVVGDNIEILSGRVYLMSSGTTAAGSWKYFDIATSSISGNLSITNFAATNSTESSFLGMDETYVPWNMLPGQGYFGNLLATGTASTTLTGSSGGLDAGLLANEFRNFQIRIVQDTATPTSVGQRRKITSHTAGPSVVYTVPAWTVTPSTSAQYVIENANEILVWAAASTSTFCYAQDAIGAAAADSWSITTYGVRPAVMAAGCTSVLPFGVDSVNIYGGGANGTDPDKNFRYSQILSFRGGATTTLDVLDIAAGANGVWTGAVAYGAGPTFTTGTCAAYDPCSLNGNKFYINQSGSNTFFRMNVYGKNMNQWSQMRYSPPGAAVVGQKMATACFTDGTTKLGFLIFQQSTSVNMFQSGLQR